MSAGRLWIRQSICALAFLLLLGALWTANVQAQEGGPSGSGTGTQRRQFFPQVVQHTPRAPSVQGRLGKTRRRFFPQVVHQTVRPRVVPVQEGELYEVQEEDTLFLLAQRFQRPLHQMLCALPPDRDPSQPLVPGEQLLIPPEHSVCHVVGEGQTLAMIARAYGVTPADIVSVPQNGFTRPPYVVVPGQRLLVPLPPGVTLSPWPYGDGRFRWPLVGVITQPWSWEHRALDIAAAEGTVVVAADTGTVTRAGWNVQGYGWLLIVDHGNAYRTYYAHLSSIFVGEDEIVLEGEPIGRVGATGNSTGPHLHFEIRDYDVQADPLTLLPTPTPEPYTP